MVSRRKVLGYGANTAAVLVLPKLIGPRLRAPVVTDRPILTDDFTTLGTQEIIGRTIVDSTGVPYTWTQLYPSPAWRSGPFFSTGDPGIVDGKLVRRDPDSAMYPGLLLPRVPSRVEVDFMFDPNGRGGRSVFIHLFADTDGTKTTVELPLHLSIGEKGYAVKAVSTTAGESVLTGFGRFPDVGNVKYADGTQLAYGVLHTVILDMVKDRLTITFPVATNTPPVTLIDARLTQARHPGGGDGRFLVLEDESDSGIEPYNAFFGVRINLGKLA